MKIGMILNPTRSGHHNIYWLAGLCKCPEITEIFSNSKIAEPYKWFNHDDPNVSITTIKDIESRTDLDFVIYGWHYVMKCKELPRAKSYRVMLNVQDAITFTADAHKTNFLNASDICFKISLAKDREMYYTPSKRPECWAWRQLTKKQTEKLHPLMYIGSYFLDYPDMPFTNKYDISFTGSKTSGDRVKSVIMLKDRYGDRFLGGFRLLPGHSWTKPGAVFDEDGYNIHPIDVPDNLKSDYVPKKTYLSLMRDSTISFSPCGFGRNTHRTIDIMCMGGCGLVADISHIDFGHLGPVEHEHYIGYKKGCADLMEKTEHLLNNPIEAEAIGDRAKKFMIETYRDNGRMAKEYILDALKE